MKTQAVSNIKFNAKFQTKEDLHNAAAFVNMSDAQLQELAYKSIDKKEDKRAQRAIFSTFLAIPIVDTIASGVLVQKFVRNSSGTPPTEIISKIPVSLSERMHVLGETALGWGIVLAAAEIYFAIKNQFVKDSPGSQRFGQEHPVLSFAGDLVVIFAASLLGMSGRRKLLGKLEEKYPESAKGFSEKIDGLGKEIDKSDFNTKTLPKIGEWFAKLEKEHPFVHGTGKFALANSVWILLGVGLIQMLRYGRDKYDKVEQKYDSLRTSQLKTAKKMINNLTVQRDVLAQNQPVLAADLEKVMNGEKPVSKKEIQEMKKNAKIYEAEKINTRALTNEFAKQPQEPEIISEIEIIKIIHIPDKNDEK